MVVTMIARMVDDIVTAEAEARPNLNAQTTVQFTIPIAQRREGLARHRSGEDSQGMVAILIEIMMGSDANRRLRRRNILARKGEAKNRYLSWKCDCRKPATVPSSSIGRLLGMGGSMSFALATILQESGRATSC